MLRLFSMDHNNLFNFAVGGLAIAGLATLPGLSAVVSQIRNRTVKDNFYEDEDGKASPEAVAAFSQKGSKFAVVFLAATTAALSLAVSVLSTIRPGQGDEDLFLQTWVATAAWVSLSSQFILFEDTQMFLCKRVSLTSAVTHGSIACYSCPGCLSGRCSPVHQSI